MKSYTVKVDRRGKHTVQYECSQCRSPLQSPLEEAGQKFDCPTCNATVQTPGYAELEKLRQNTQMPVNPARNVLPLTFAATLLIVVAIFYFALVWPLKMELRKVNEQLADTRAKLNDSAAIITPPIPLMKSVELDEVRLSLTRAESKIAALSAELTTTKEVVAKLNRPTNAATSATTQATKVMTPSVASASTSPTKSAAELASIGGSAWLTRNNAASDLMRGLRVKILQTTCPFPAYAASVEAEAAQWDYDDKKTVASFSQDADTAKLIPPEGERYEKKRAEALHAIAAGSKVDVATDAAFETLKAGAAYRDRNVGRYVPNFAAVVKATMLFQTVSNADGKWSIAGLPDGRYFVYARFESDTTYVEWLVPLTISNGKADPISLDLSNENAALVNSR